MKTRTLIFTLFTSISILLFAQGFAFADPPPVITGCLQKSTGKIYNAQIDTEPTLPCALFDEEISWDQVGPAGADGNDGNDGNDGADGADGQDGIDGEPGPAGPPGAPQFILKDKNGEQVGTVVTVNDDSVGFFDANGFQVSNRSVLTAIDIQKADTTTATVAISVDRFNIRFQHRLLFEDINCMGSPRHKEVIVDVDFPPAFTMAAVVVGDPDQPDARKLYIQTDEAEIPQMREIKSVFFDDVCNNFFNPMSILTVSMVLIDGVLDQFPGPYTLEKAAGADGTNIQVHLEDDNDSACGSFPFPNINDPNTFGWCPNDTRTSFIITDPYYRPYDNR